MNHFRPASLPAFLDRLAPAVRQAQWTDRQWAEKAQLRPETLARLKQRDDCDLNTLTALADAVGWQLRLDPALDREMPAQFGRDAEAALLDLCASGSLDVRRWLDAGPRYFMAGLAVLVSNARGTDHEGLCALAEALYPGMTEVTVWNQWLAESPVKPTRFLPMLEQAGAAKKQVARGALF